MDKTCLITWRLVSTFVGLAFLFATLSNANEYYFSALGNDQTGTGSQASPWRSISKFNSIDLTPGDSAFFRSGDTFHGSLVLDANDAGTDPNGNLIAPVTIGSYGGPSGSRAIIRSLPTAQALLAVDGGGFEVQDLEFANGGSYASNSFSGIQFRSDQSSSSALTHFQHIRLDNVVARGFHASGLAIDATSNVGYRDVEIKNSQFYENEFAGVEIGSSDWTELVHQNIRIDGVTVRDNPGYSGCSPHCGHGLVLGQVDGAIIENSIAASNGVVAGKGNVGFWTWQSNDITIQHNTAYGNRSPMGGDGGGFDIDGGVTNSKVQYNASQNNAGAGYLLAEFAFADPMQHNVIRYNLSVNDGIDSYGAITISGEDATSRASSSIIHNNTIVVDRNVAPASMGAVLFLNSQHEEIDFVNNLFVALNGATLIDGTTTADKAKFINNAYWTAGSPMLIGGTAYASIEQWAAATGQEFANGQVYGFESDPNFGPGTDFAPHRPSGIIDAGLSLASDLWPSWLVDLGSIDLVGTNTPQGAALDIGAIEVAAMTGDFNGDGSVDGADYVIWRKTLGSVGSGLIADANHNGMVDADDVGIWRANFGMLGAGAQTRGDISPIDVVPEPTSFAYVVTALASLISILRPQYAGRSPARGDVVQGSIVGDSFSVPQVCADIY
jgi:hypothetical protein